MQTINTTPGSVPHLAAPVSFFYPQFTKVEPPEGSNATCGWVGNVQPLASDDDARSFLELVEQGGSCEVDTGTLIVPYTAGTHPLREKLVGMNSSCRLLILEQPAPAEPRAFLISPAFDANLIDTHPHCRHDYPLRYEEKNLIGMCVYSGAEHSVSNSPLGLVSFIDIVVTHVARHLIWLKSRMLFQFIREQGITLTHNPGPGEIIVPDPRDNKWNPFLKTPAFFTPFWLGYWPGAVAKAANASQHISLLDPNGPCYCTSGTAYKDCHLATDHIVQMNEASRARSVATAHRLILESRRRVDMLQPCDASRALAQTLLPQALSQAQPEIP